MKNLDEVRMEAYSLSQRRLEDQTNAALAADQRAMSVAGLTLAAAAILCGLSPNAVAPSALLLGSVLLIISAGMAWYSARPVDFFMPGSHFRAFDSDIASERSPVDVLTEMGKNNDAAIDANDTLLTSNARTLGRSFLVAIFGVLVAVVPQIVVTLSCFTD